MNLTYTTGIPDGPHNPSADQPPMKVNNDSNATLWTIDHFGFNDNLGGYHDIIHQPAQLSDPAPIAGPPQINQVYSKSYLPNTTGGMSDTQLFTETALGKISQLTGYLAGASSGTDGWVWSGGLLFQWGVVTSAFSSGSTTGSVTFKDRVSGAIPFINNCFIVTGNPLVSFASLPNSQASVNIRKSTLSNTKFDWQFFTNSNQYIGFFWMAIGN